MRPSQLFVILSILAVAMLWGVSLSAFHDGGGAHCNGCHTMHNSVDGIFVDPANPSGNDFLLNQATPTDTCLLCHATRLGAVFSDSATAPDPQKGSGNFAFLLATNLNDGHSGASHPISGDAAGHNVISLTKGVAEDATLSSAPGGTFPSRDLACSSCHDPHGNASFRLLYGVGALKSGVLFNNPAPEAYGISIHGGSESNDNHTAYRSGVSGWCGNCHGEFHDNFGGRIIHPSGSTLGSTIASMYNSYNGTEDPNGGVQATAYLAEVPFEDPRDTNTTSSTAGPNSASRVMCLSCHRAHASSAPDSGRWDFSVTLLHEDGEESGSFKLPDPYNSDNQRSLCNKCHGKDLNSTIVME